jgi:DNA-binding NtrC family response regulator
VETTGARVLIVDDDANSRQLLEVRLRALECEVSMATDGREALAAVQQEVPALMLLDLNMPGMSGLELLRTVRRDGIDLPIIVITAYGSIEAAVEAMKEGAYDFLPKPFDPKHFEVVVGKALEREGFKRGLGLLAEEADQRHALVPGTSRIMKDVIETTRKAAASRATVLLLGESGTGKEIFARAIHGWGERKDRPFVAVNCVGLSRELLESELFGYEKGAFTGAYQLQKGKMELANHGTVFLDEIGDLATDLQSKLLRFLQEREFERVGGAKPIRVDVRIVGATSRNLEEVVAAGRFREDLYHRLNVVPITLPPLRERREDILELARFFLQRFGLETKKRFTGLARDVQEPLLGYDWPGNVRELANVIERAVVLGPGPEVTLRDLPARIVAAAPKMSTDSFSYRQALDVARRTVITRALAQTDGNRAAAARALGIHKTYLLQLMRGLGID